MAYFALLWKARTIEKYRLNYEKQKLNSIRLSETQNPKKTFYQKLKLYNCNTKKKISQNFKNWYPEGSTMHGFFYYMTTDQTFPNFVLKSIIGFIGGVVLTYLCFMFFVFQLAISLVHATIMSSVIGVLLTLGLAFSYRIRCLVFLLIPQFFSRVGRYTLTCYALVLILTGPATNTLKNSEVLSESMACKQEQIKASVTQIKDSMQKPFDALKDSIQILIDKVKHLASKMKTIMIVLHRLTMSMALTLQSTYFYLDSVTRSCNKKLGTPYEMCTLAVEKGVADCQAALGIRLALVCNTAYVANIVCIAVKPLKHICVFIEFVNGNIVSSVEKKLFAFTEHMKAMLKLEVKFHHSYSFSSNTSRSASQVAAGVVTEIRRRADPLLTWLSWSSCVTSLFLLLIIFRAKHYQNMFETRSRFDNRYITKELRELDLKRMRQSRETVLPLNRREKAKYITTTSFRLVSNEKIHLSRSAVFMVITTFKLMIHMVADYSLYWVLMMIRYHGRFITPMRMGAEDPRMIVSGKGVLSRFLKALLGSLHAPFEIPPHSPISCLPDPYPPDFRRYAQIGILIVLLWFFAIFEPYGLRLRHVIMGLYRPERAKARAVWLYNHIQRTRCMVCVGGFMKYARRKLHRENKYSSDAKYTFRNWLNNHIPCTWLKSFLGVGPDSPCCLLCGTLEYCDDSDTSLIRCITPNCPGTYCTRCFSDIGNLCTICLSPADYGDMSDISLEKGSSDESDDDDDGIYCPIRGTNTDLRSDDSDDEDKDCQTEDESYNAKEDIKEKGVILLSPKSSQSIDMHKDFIKYNNRAKDENRDNVPLLNQSDSDSDAENFDYKDRKLSKAMTKRHSRYSETVKSDRAYQKSAQNNYNKGTCKYCTPGNTTCTCEKSSICQLKAEFRKALELATGKAHIMKISSSVKRGDESVQCKADSKQLGVQTSPYFMPKPEPENIESKLISSILKKRLSESQPSKETGKDSCPSKSSLKQRIRRKRRKSYQRLSFSTATEYSIKISDKHVCVKKIFRVSKAAKRLRSKCKLLFRHKKCGKQVFRRWFQRFTKRLRYRKYLFHKLGSGKYKTLSDNKNNQTTPNEKVTGSPNDCKTDNGTKNSCPKKGKMTVPMKLLGSKRKLRLGLTCKKYGNNFSGSKCIASSETNKIVSFCRTEHAPYEYERTNHKRRKKLLRHNTKEHCSIIERMKQNNEDTRKYRISSYLSEQEWMKRQNVKDLTPTATTIDIANQNDWQPVEESEIGDHNTETRNIETGMENYDKDNNVKPIQQTESRFARSSIDMQAIHKKLYNSLEMQLSSSSSNYLSYADQQLVAAVESPKETVDSFKFNTSQSQTLDYDMSRSLEYYRSIGMKDFDENDDQFQELQKYDNRSKYAGPVKKGGAGFEHASLQDFVNDCNENSLYASQCNLGLENMGREALKVMDDGKFLQPTCTNKEHKPKVDKQLPKIFSPFATLYSCLFGTKRRTPRNDEALELVKVDEEVTAYPVVKSCACQHFKIESPSCIKKPITEQPKNLVSTAQSISRADLHDAQVNAVQPTCTCATQSLVSRKEAGTSCRTSHNKDCASYKSCRGHNDEYGSKRIMEGHRDVSTIHKDCLKKIANFGVQCHYDQKYVVSARSQVKFSPETSPETSKCPRHLKTNQNIKEHLKQKSTTKPKAKRRSPAHPRKQQSYPSSDSEISHSDTKTDTTICSHATIEYVDETSRRFTRRRTNVVTKANRSTLTDTTKIADVSTVTSDWWSPMLERKSKRFELTKGYRVKMKSRSPVDKKDKGISTEGRVVTFKSDHQIIPNNDTQDIMSPSRYLLESQRYYNELFNSDFKATAAVKFSQQASPRKVQIAVEAEERQSSYLQLSRNTKQRLAVKKLRHNKSQAPDRDAVVLKKGENNLKRGCVSSDHISMDCRCNSTDTTGSV